MVIGVSIAESTRWLSFCQVIPIVFTPLLGTITDKMSFDIASTWFKVNSSALVLYSVSNPYLSTKGTGNLSTKGTSKVPGIPPIVQSRINISNEGWKHVVDRHFSNKNASQFTISQDELRSLLSSKDIVKSPVIRSIDSTDGVLYVREVTLDKPIGLDKFNDFKPTSTMTIIIDKHGNLVTAFPGLLK